MTVFRVWSAMQAGQECTSGAKVAELADALDLGSSGVTRESSSLSFRTICDVYSQSNRYPFLRKPEAGHSRITKTHAGLS